MLRSRFPALARSTSLLCFVLGIAILSWSFIAKCVLFVPPAGSGNFDKASKISGPKATISYEDFSAIASRRFQEPLFDPPPPAPVAPPVKSRPQPPAVKLLATMLDASGNRAMFSDPKGAIHIVHVGGKLGEGTAVAQVKEIDSTHVVLDYQGESVVLQLGTKQ